MEGLCRTSAQGQAVCNGSGKSDEARLDVFWWSHLSKGRRDGGGGGGVSAV